MNIQFLEREGSFLLSWEIELLKKNSAPWSQRFTETSVPVYSEERLDGSTWNTDKEKKNYKEDSKKQLLWLYF
jgi:hypothetical protein